MEVSKEKFNKLPQLDRIEYRQRHNGMVGNARAFCVVYFLTLLLIIPTSVLGDYEIISNVFYYVGFVLLVLATILFLTGMYGVTKDMNELEEEYFKIEVRKK